MSATDRANKMAVLRLENDRLRRERDGMITANAELLKRIAAELEQLETIIAEAQQHGVGFGAANVRNDAGVWWYEFILFNPVDGPMADTYRAEGATLVEAARKACELWKASRE